jgi:microcystin-dependent protein
MKSKLLLLSFLMLLTVATTFAQTSASASGIAIQGIARDNNNTAITRTLVLKFTIYYGANTPIYNVSQTLVTDAFGVFSTVINPGVANNSLIANNQASLKIEEGTTIISDEPLNHVPYAIAANNGVPTGSIMPFIGTTAPEGWALCNGSPLPTTATVLIALIGSKTPDLRGMFLRGAGANAGNGKSGPGLTQTQNDGMKSHLHQAGTLRSSTHIQADHTHTRGVRIANIGINKDGSLNQFNVNTQLQSQASPLVNESTGPGGGGSHEHGIINSTAVSEVNDNGADETRPVNYGVNYIIKL